jgi:hypothetical protein
MNNMRHASLSTPMVSSDVPARRRPRMFMPTRRARSPWAIVNGGTSCEHIAPPPSIARRPTRLNWCTADNPPRIAPSPTVTCPPIAAEFANVVSDPTMQSCATWLLAMK